MGEVTLKVREVSADEECNTPNPTADDISSYCMEEAGIEEARVIKGRE